MRAWRNLLGALRQRSLATAIDNDLTPARHPALHIPKDRTDSGGNSNNSGSVSSNLHPPWRKQAAETKPLRMV